MFRDAEVPVIVSGDEDVRLSSISTAQFRAAIECLRDPVAVLFPRRDATGAVVDLIYRLVNTALLQLHGRTEDEIVGHGHVALFGRNQEDVWSTCLAVLDSGETRRLRVSWPRPDGSEGRFAVTIAPFENGVIITSYDVTPDTRVEVQLRQERDLLNAVLDVAGAGIAVTDGAGYIERYNRQSEVNSGFREAEVLGLHYGSIFPEPERAQIIDLVEHVSATQPMVSRVNRIVTKSGELRVLRWSYTALFDDTGTRTHLIGVGIDITDEARAKEELARRAEEFEIANRELDRLNADLARSNADLEQFAYVASHDLREPLRAISGPLNYIAENYKGQLDERADMFIDFAVDGARRMEHLIDGLLTYSRVGRDESTLTATDADAIAREAIEALRSLLESTQAMVSLQQLPVVLAEPHELSQVFQNLISNAVKFVAPGVSPRITISAEPVPTGWRFDVTDNGIGIPPKLRERAFNMFKRVHPPGEYPGTGIGLAVVKKIITRHGGEVGIDDAPIGTGCRVWFTLPAPDGPD